MTFAAGYTLDLYCDNTDADFLNGGPHGHDEFPHQFYGENWFEVVREARSRGWLVNRSTRHTLCPKCSGKRR